MTTQPEFAFWFPDVGWGVENYGTDPDEEIEITPQDWRANRDPQLIRAVEVALEQIEKADIITEEKITNIDVLSIDIDGKDLTELKRLTLIKPKTIIISR